MRKTELFEKVANLEVKLEKECSEKKKECIRDVKAKGGKVNPYAVCNASVGKGINSIESILEKTEHLQLVRAKEQLRLGRKQGAKGLKMNDKEYEDHMRALESRVRDLGEYL